MADLDDGPDQAPLPAEQLQETVVQLLSATHYDLILTHGPKGEYTRHRRHEECSQSVIELWRLGRVHTDRLWLFAYEDGDGTHLPQVHVDADRRDILPIYVWREKQRLITETYGYGAESWEAQATPREEGYWCFDSVRATVERATSWENRS